MGWPTPPLGAVAATLVPQRDKPPELSGPIPWVRIEDFDGPELSASKSGQGVTEETVAAMNLRVMPVGAVVCTCSCNMGATAIVTAPLVTNQTFIGLVPDAARLSSRYLFYSLAAYKPLLDAEATGTIQQYLSQDDFRQLRIPLPSLSVQHAITDFLDPETARIDRLIAARRETAYLLELRRRAVIDEALRCTNGPRREVRVKYLIRGIQQGWSPECEARPADDAEWGVLKAGCTNNGLFRAAENKALPPGIEPKPDLEVRPGDLLVSRANTKELLASVCVVPEVRPHLLLCDKLYRLVPSPDTDPRFLAYALSTSSARREIESDATGTSDSMQNISQSTIRELRINAPLTRRLQSDIADRLDRMLAQLTLLRESPGRHVDLLLERRQALITAAVTGQIDIPGVAA
ncbi:MAG: restriction endonuclease subunit S [Candidatus Limnocylindrales bacterium]|jgi:type I restriction enzyme S subunit